MSGARLPPGLIDLLLARTTIPVSSGRAFSVFNHALQRRLAHSAAALTAHDAGSPDAVVRPIPPAQGNRDLYASVYARRTAREAVASTFRSPSPRSSVATLEEKARSLQSAIEAEESALEEGSYSEAQLVSLYEDLLALPAVSKPAVLETPQKAIEECKATVHSIASRILPGDSQDPASPSGSTFAQRLLQRRQNPGAQPGLETPEPSIDLSSAPLHVALISRLDDMLRSVQAMHASVTPQETNIQVEIDIAGAGLMVDNEWNALVQYCLIEHDPQSAERAIEMMQRFNLKISENIFNSVLKYHVDARNLEEVNRVVEKYLKESPTEIQRELHVKAFLKATPETEFPARALELLHGYETRGLPAPQRSYTQVITRLFDNRTAISHAHAWDLFSHMRYVAHPEPDVVMYTAMIRACGMPSLSARGEPERAVDLWTEMTVEKRLAPTEGAYAAVIFACAHSGDRAYVHEAFRFAKQMLDAHRDARGRSQFRPNRWVYDALLEGAKRVGDLPRVRWLLAEMVREHVGRGDREVVIDAAVMEHVFNAYAAWRVPFRRSQAVVVDGETMQKGGSAQDSASQDTSAQASSAEQATGVTTVDRPSFRILPPQTHAEVVREVDALFARITHKQNDFEDDGPFSESFRGVKPTTRLWNAYLSVYYMHAPLDKCIALFNTLFPRAGSEVTRNAWTYVDALERCAGAPKQDRKMALQFAREVWEAWLPMESDWQLRGENAAAASVDARLVERTYAAMIRVLALCRQLDAAMELVQLFVRLYPPSVVRTPPPNNPYRSARTALVGERPLIHLVSNTSVPDDTVPPLLSFPEVELLHHRLVVAGRADDIGFLKWMCMSYEGQLRRRRDAWLKTPPPDSFGVVTAEETAADDMDQKIGRPRRQG